MKVAAIILMCAAGLAVGAPILLWAVGETVDSRAQYEEGK